MRRQRRAAGNTADGSTLRADDNANRGWLLLGARGQGQVKHAFNASRLCDKHPTVYNVSRARPMGPLKFMRRDRGINYLTK